MLLYEMYKYIKKLSRGKFLKADISLRQAVRAGPRVRQESTVLMLSEKNQSHLTHVDRIIITCSYIIEFLFCHVLSRLHLVNMCFTGTV